MADILLPPWLSIANTVFSVRDFTGVSASPFNGVTRTADLGGTRLRAALEMTACGGSSTLVERGALMSFLTKLRGKQNRAYLFDPGYRQRGSFPGPELLTNNTFASGTTGYGTGGGASISVHDRMMRTTRTSNAGSTRFNRGSIATTAYAPYAMRAFVYDGPVAANVRAFLQDTSGTLATQVAGPGLASTLLVTPETTVAIAVVAGVTGVAGEYWDVPYVSLARCALVDAGVNLLLRSDEFDNASWTKTNATVGANALLAPDGTTTADTLIDNGVNGAHAVNQAFTVTTSATDIQFTACVQAAGQSFVMLQLNDGTSVANQYFNLSTGAVGASGSTGASWANRRAFVTALGSGWYRCTIVARKTGSATSITASLFAASADGTSSYAGVSTAAITMWRATASMSSVPARLKASTSATVPNGESQVTGAVFLKGLPASTNGLLLPGDVIEVTGGRGSEIKIVTASLNSDASGLGHVQFEPPIRVTPSDNAMVHINQPFGRFIFSGDMPEWSTDPGIITTASTEFEEV